MGYLKGYENIAQATGGIPALPSEEIIKSFQIEVFNLISNAYKIIKTPDKILEKPDETKISLSLFVALKQLCNGGSWVNCEQHEFTEEIINGDKKPISAKRFDLYFGNWNTTKRIEYGIEAKLLCENDFLGLRSKFLVGEYIGDRGMSKYINGIYINMGCMLGYIVEGRVNAIISKLNSQIETTLDASQILIKENNPNLVHKEIYKSVHKQKLKYGMFHLMLHFN